MAIILKAELETAMKACMAGVAKGKSDIKGADAFIFEDGIVYSFNNDIAVSVPIPYPDLKGTIKADVALKLFSKLRTHEVEITIKKNYWEIISGSTKIKLKKLKDDCMERIESLEIEDHDMHEISPDFHRALLACTLSKNKSDHEGVAFNGSYAMSTDVARMSFFKLSTPMPKFWIGEEACKFLVNMDEIEEYRIDDVWAHFKMSDGTYFSARRIGDAIYPFSEMLDIYKHYKKAGEAEGVAYNVFPEGVKGAVERVSELSEMMGTRPVVDIHFSKEDMVLKGAADAGEIEETLKLTEPFEDEVSIDTTMTADFLKEAVSKASRFYFIDGRNAKALVIEGEQFLQITNSIVR